MMRDGLMRYWRGYPVAATIAVLSLACYQLISWAEAPSPAAKQWLNRGVSDYNRGYVQRAIPSFEKAAKLSPNSEEAFVWLGKSATKQGGNVNLQRAQIAFGSALKINPNHPEALVSLGEILSWNPTTHADAAAMLARALKYGSSLSEARKIAATQTLVNLLLWSNRADEALAYAKPLASIASVQNNPAWLQSYAAVLTRTGSASEALEIYEGKLKAASNTKDLKLQSAYLSALIEQSKNDDAMRVYQLLKASLGTLSSAQQTPLKRELAGMAYVLGEFNDAVAFDQSLPEPLRSSRDTRLRIARALSKAQRTPEAIDAFQALYTNGELTGEQKMEYADYLQSLNLDPGVLPAPDIIGTLYREAAQNNPASGMVQIRMAQYYANQPGHFKEAVAAYSEASQTFNPSLAKTAQQELVDLLKSSKDNPQFADDVFKTLLQQNPDNTDIKLAYGDFLSWQEQRRPEAIQLFFDLRETQKLEQVLFWQTPKADLIPLYQQILSAMPQSKAAKLSLARAYAQDQQNTETYSQAITLYQDLKTQYPEDATITKEWASILTSDPARRKEAMAALDSILSQSPGDTATRITYAKLLSYEQQFSKALKAFDEILSEHPEHHDALLGKGQALLWSGQPFAAKKLLEKMFTENPQDIEVGLALAEAEKNIGRYDRALEILQQLKPHLKSNAPEENNFIEESEFILCGGAAVSPTIIYDYSVLPIQEEIPGVTRILEGLAEAPPQISPQKLQEIKQDIQVLNMAIEALEALQSSSEQQLNSLKQSMNATVNDANTQGGSQFHAALKEDDESISLLSQLEDSSPIQGFPQTLTLYQDSSNPLLTGQGRWVSDNYGSIEEAIQKNMRPEFRAGFGYSMQDGEDTTNKFNSWGFPNQLSMALTPQIRVRGGISPRRYYLPDTPVDPDDNFGLQYSLGGTVQAWDRLSLDGDIGLTQFTQTDDTNITWQASGKYTFSDRISMRVGGRRWLLDNSLQSIAGLKPNEGPFRGDVVGQANENAVYGELNTRLFQHVDWNLGYEWALITGNEMPDNTKNQFYTSVGYSHEFNEKFRARIGYEFFSMLFDKNATNGYWGMSAGDPRQPLVILSPPIRPESGYVFGGYFSPEQFFLNALRLDLYGNAFNKFIEYHLGGSLGIQSFNHGHEINDSSPTGLSSAFNVRLLMNFTDWLSGYGDADFMDAAGNFQRWRFGGGLIVRPDIPALSPLVKK